MRKAVDISKLSPSTRSWVLDLQSQGKNARSIALYAGVIEKINLTTNTNDGISWTADTLRLYLAQRLTEVSPTTVSLEGRAARVFTRWMQREGLQAKDLFANVTIPKPTVPIRKLMTVDGLDVYGHVAEVDGKTGVRKVAFGSRTAKLIDYWTRVRDRYAHAGTTQRLWVGDRGALTEDGVRQLLWRVSEQVLDERISPHVLRHSWAHHQMDTGMADRHIMFLGGWKSSTMLGYYAREGQERRALNEFVSHLDPEHRRRL
jgi:site-specific recombinase XerD